jgi:F-type H+-transporting ATPase subunit b
MIDLKFVTVETFLIQAVILLIVLWVLNRFVFKPYLAYLDEMEMKQKKVEDDYKNIEIITKEAQKKADDTLSEARKTWEAIIQEAESIAKRKREDIIAKADGDARDIVWSGKNEIEKERIGMVNSLKWMVVDLMMKLHTKILKDEKLSRDFIEKSLQDINH